MTREGGKVIYVGKAINLRKRVSSYWKQTDKQGAKTQALIKQVAKLDFIATDTETEALILENELIKKYQPQYNVLLRDDKTFQYIRVGLDQKFPEITTVRRVNPQDTKSRDPNRPRYFGPYTVGGAVRNTLKLLNGIFPLCGKARELNRRLPRSDGSDLAMTRGSVKAPCLNYHLGRCLGVCVGKATSSDYRSAIEEVVKFLGGDTKDVIKYLQSRMSRLSAERRFEEAARLRDRINSLESLFEQQKVSRPKDLEQDFLGMLVEGEKMIISRAQVRSGRLLGQQIFVLRAPLKDAESDLMSQAIVTIYDRVFEDLPREIIVPVLPEDASAIEKWLSSRRGTKVVVSVPQRGPNQKLLSLAQRNAAQHSGSLLDVDERLGVKKALTELKNLLKLKKLERLEAYDISHLGGTHTVGSMVVFKDGKPDKNGYRRFRIKTVPGIDDYAALGEVITRRLSPKRKMDKRFAATLPDAVLIDGGRGQLSSVLKHVSADDERKIRFFSLAKREEEVFLPGVSRPVILSKDSVALQLLQRLRDEAHRFAISYQIVLRFKQITGDTEKIPGIGATARKKLVKAFGSLAAARRASDAELSQVLSPKQIQLFKS
jgi:excinuclease ABC subunit C